MKLLVAIIVGLTLASFVSFFWWTQALAPASPGSLSPQTFVVAKGQSASDVISSLFQQHLLKSTLAARLYLQFSRLDGKILPGAYSLSPSYNLKSIFASLTSGPKDVWITFPEGWRREQYAARLAAYLRDFNSQEFIELTATREGRLFPDTYLIPTYISMSDLIGIFTDTFDRKVGPIDSDTLILASLVEREARVDAERPTVAGILAKRLAANWPLQVDATIQYAKGSAPAWWVPITTTKFPSLYNTYLHPGLPPAPISNPSLASISAVRKPQPSTYWYYLHDSSGQIHYAATFLEHQLNIDKYLRP